ncbi:MAG: hypothetical protein M1826_005453 [Phylliscum demangeonii]|nr:MAG: hypothetical protein M1826_005453 [Phylliscum demangeonii]
MGLLVVRSRRRRRRRARDRKQAADTAEQLHGLRPGEEESSEGWMKPELSDENVPPFCSAFLLAAPGLGPRVELADSNGDKHHADDSGGFVELDSSAVTPLPPPPPSKPRRGVVKEPKLSPSRSPPPPPPPSPAAAPAGAPAAAVAAAGDLAPEPVL